MKIAVISDIHGNLEALKTTLADIQKRKVDKIFCIGDTIAKGVHTEECIKLVQENCEVVLQGNCDRHFSKHHEDLSIFPEVEKNRIIWTQRTLTKESMEYLQNLPYSYEFYLSGRLIRLFHATPEKDNQAVIDVETFETKYAMFEPSTKTMSQKIADVVIFGHIHHPFLETLYNKMLINAGSVGNSFDSVRNSKKDGKAEFTTQSSYVILEGEYGKEVTEQGEDFSVQFVRVPYDMEKELKDAHLSFEEDTYTYELRNGKYRNMKKINDNFERLGFNPKDI